MNKPLLTILFCLLLTSRLTAQNIFPQKVEGCNTARFCLDCGDTKATYDPAAFAEIIKSVNGMYKFGTGKGMIMFQVLVDSVGRGCVLSHTDATKNQVTRGLIGFLNVCKWAPAMESGKAVASSINILFTIQDGKLSGAKQGIDMNAFKQGLGSKGEPTVYNKQYKYDNPSLATYEFTSWNRENSNLPVNIAQHCVVDKNGTIWYATIDGLMQFDGSKFIAMDASNSPFKATEFPTALGLDNSKNLWAATNSAIFKYDNGQWESFDSTRTQMSITYSITAGAGDEVIIGSMRGVAVTKNGNWKVVEKTSPDVPVKQVHHAYRDKKGRLWIGTFRGSSMIDKDNKATGYNGSDTPLSNVCITSAAEDENGNVYFGVYAYDKKGAEKDEEGLVVLTADGKWLHYNTKNSGLPANYINSLFYDKFEKVLWISSHSAGLVRYDLKGGWENYHNKNSGVPSYDVYQLTQDVNGVLYAATYFGLLKVKKK